jgi:hypothetical protein
VVEGMGTGQPSFPTASSTQIVQTCEVAGRKVKPPDRNGSKRRNRPDDSKTSSDAMSGWIHGVTDHVAGRRNA